MPFNRTWDSSCPCVYDQWKEDGVSYVIQDLPPKDEEEALKLFVEHFLPDEPLCSTSGIREDPSSMFSFSRCWRTCFKQRMSLACYAEKDGERTLAAFNCCLVRCRGEKEEVLMEGEPFINVYKVLEYVDKKRDAFEYFGLDKLLYGMGLVVKREYRGARLGARVLAAREPLSRAMDIKGTYTMFSGPASQKSAAKAGFTTICEASFRELADAGLKYPRDDRVVKLMVKRYD